jgi:hypothetical protein
MLIVDVGIEAVTRNRHDIEVLTILVEPLPSDLGAVVDNCARLQLELHLAVTEDLSDELWLEEGLAARNVELLHAGVCEEAKAMLGSLDGKDDTVLRCVKAK